MAIFIHRFDPTAASANNLVVEEAHNLVNATALVLVANDGLFYTKSLVVKKVLTNTILAAGVDYNFQGFDAEITALTGYECACAIAFNDPTISGAITLSYQAVGGKEGEISSFIAELRDRIAALNLTNATWSQVKNKPATYPPEPHTHNTLTDLTGLEAVRAVLSKIQIALTDARIPTLSGGSLSNKVDRLLAILTVQRKDINSIASTVARAAASDGFAAGTRMLFAQAAAPLGWTQDISDAATNRMLRVVNTVGAGVGGSHDPTIMNVVPVHTHGFVTGTESVSHTHYDTGHGHPYNSKNANQPEAPTGTVTPVWAGDTTQTTGNGYANLGAPSAPHSHSGATDNGSSATNWTPRYNNVIICTKN